MSKKVETVNVSAAPQILTPKQQSKHCLPMGGLYGILFVFVVVSIAYSTYMVVVGTQGYAAKIMLIPQALFAAFILIFKFSKS